MSLIAYDSEISVTGNTTVGELQAQLRLGSTADYFISLSGKELKDEETMSSVGAVAGSVFNVQLRRPPRGLVRRAASGPAGEREDIGIWGSHASSPLACLLVSGSGSGVRGGAQGEENEVRATVLSLTAAKFAGRSYHTDATVTTPIAVPEEVLSASQRRALVALTDAIEAHGGVASRDAARPEEDAESDFKTTLSLADLARTLDQATVDGLKRAFGGRVDMVKLRRVRARPAGEEYCINFHLDHAHRTLSVALNDPSEYEGGRIVYLAADGQVHTPVRRPGTALVHDNTCVHGVTKLTRGTRYHLFLLQHGQ